MLMAYSTLIIDFKSECDSLKVRETLETMKK